MLGTGTLRSLTPISRLRGEIGVRHASGMRLSDDRIEAKLGELPGWTREGEGIRRDFVFDGFASAVAFVVRTAFDAEAADHHPDILISSYKNVTLTLTTHSAGGITDKDFAAAAAADRVFARWNAAR